MKKYLTLIFLGIAFLFVFYSAQNSVNSPQNKMQLSLPQLSFFPGSTPTPAPSAGDSFPEKKELNDKKIQGQKNLEDYFAKVAEKKGGAYAYNLLKVAKLPYPSDLHLIAHAIGYVLYKQQGANGIKVCAADFEYGCSHSIVIGLFEEKGIKALPDIIQACKNAPGNNSYASCFHGVGHGVLVFVGFNLPKAIDLCKEMRTGSYSVEYSECVGGASMEMIDGGIGDPPTWAKESPKYLLANDPLAPCDQPYYPEEVRGICYTYLTPHLIDASGTSWGNPDPAFFPKAFSFCKAIANPMQRDSCFGGFGKDFPLVTNNRNIETFDGMTDGQFANLFYWCSASNDSHATDVCLSYALGTFYWNGANSFTVPLHLCRVIPDKQHQSACYDNLINLIAGNPGTAPYFRSFCSSLPIDFQTTCKEKTKI